MQFCPDTSPPVLAGKRITWFCPVYKKKDDTKLTFHGDSDDDDVADGVYDDDLVAVMVVMIVVMMVMVTIMVTMHGG
jgi:hypothetical protein